MCSKCGHYPRAFPESSNPWCKPCLNEYQAEYAANRKSRDSGKGFASGAEEMRRQILAGLGRMNPAGMLRISETSSWIAGVPTPRPKDNL